MAASNKSVTIQPKHDQDANIDESGTECQNTITRLRRVMNTINTYTDGEQCIQFVKQVQDEKVCMVISGALGKHIIPHVHHMSQVDSIFIFCGNKQYHEQWAKDWPKVKGVYTDIELICDALKQSAKDCEQNAIGFSLVATGADSSNMNLDRLDPTFMYTQITKEILLVIEFEQKHILDFTKYCRDVLEDNQQQLNIVDNFEQNYHKRTPIYWYTLESFLYSMLNRALRLSDIDVIVKMGFLIGDLHRQIEDLHQQQFSGSIAEEQFTVYRGQGMFKEEFEGISKTKGGLIAFNIFLSTSRTELVAVPFAKRALRNPEMVGILFEMKVDPKQSTTPYASVAVEGAFGDKENEILFAMQTVFRIRDIQAMDENVRLFRVKLELTNDNDKDLQVLTKYIREETFPDEQGWRRLALVLWKLGRPKQTEEIYRILLEQESDERQMGGLYGLLGLCKQNQGENDEAIRFYKKAITMYEKYSPNNLNLAKAYSNIGLVYNNMGEYAKALSYFEKDLAITQQLLPSDHPDLSMSYNNIGVVYQKIGEYPKALSYYEKDLAVTQLSLPPDHPDLASTYDNIGLIYENMKNYSKACSFYEKAVKIGQQALSLNHPNLQKHKSNLDRAKKKLQQ